VSDENGINNRYAGFFATERAGLDTLVFIGDEILSNPRLSEVDSLLKDWNKSDVDSVGFVSVTNDSAYVFPLTNYQSGLLETRTAGDNSLVSEVTRQGDYKFLYRLRVDENTLRRRNVTAKPTEYMKKLREEDRFQNTQTETGMTGDDDKSEKKDDFFQTEFGKEKQDSSSNVGRVVGTQDATPETVLTKAKLFEYRPPKFFSDYVVAGLNNTVFVVNKYQPYMGGAGPIDPSNGNDLSGLIRMGTTDLFEDIKISGGFRIATNLKDNDILFEFMNMRKRLDWGFTYYRSSNEIGAYVGNFTSPFLAKQFANYYLGKINFAIDRVRSIRATVGPRFDNIIFAADPFAPISLKFSDIKKTFGQLGVEYVYDNTLNPTLNIWKGLRWKTYVDWFTQMSGEGVDDGRFLFNGGVDARHYLPIYRNIIWAVRGAADFSWGPQKVVYYLGGTDGWLKFGDNTKDDGTFRYFDASENNKPNPQANYTYQALALNLRGFKQNVANGNNAVTINSEIRVPVFSTFLDRPINNAFLRNFQVVQFVDLGSAWDGKYNKIARPTVHYSNGGVVTVKIKAGGIGPFAGGYGFGARSTLLGYFLRFDVAWQMNGLFQGKPQTYLSLGVDF
jgi:hypothetical protein